MTPQTWDEAKLQSLIDSETGESLTRRRRNMLCYFIARVLLETWSATRTSSHPVLAEGRLWSRSVPRLRQGHKTCSMRRGKPEAAPPKVPGASHEVGNLGFVFEPPKGFLVNR